MIKDDEMASRLKIDVKNLKKLRSKIKTEVVQKEIIANGRKRSDKEDERRYLGKRGARTLKISSVFSKDLDNYRRISKRLKTIQGEEEAHELAYKEKNRLITERWKRALTKKFPISVSFKVHDLPILISK